MEVPSSLFKLRTNMVLVFAGVTTCKLTNIDIQPVNIGSYSPCDRDYTSWLRDFIRQHLGNDVVLFSTDGDGDGYLQCGKIPGVYATVDFGAGILHIETYFSKIK
jgi:hypothetical protein